MTSLNISYSRKILGSVSIDVRGINFIDLFELIADKADLKFNINEGNIYFEPDSQYFKIYKADFLSTEDLWQDIENNISVILAKNLTDNFHIKIPKTRTVYKDIIETKEEQQDLSSKSIFKNIFNNSTEALKEYNMLKQRKGLRYANITLMNTPDKLGIIKGIEILGRKTKSRKKALKELSNLEFVKEIKEQKRIKNIIKNKSKDDKNLINSFFELSKSSRTIYVYGTRKHHKEIQKYLNNIKAITTAQVLIEAKIIEVNLKKEFKSGIDWSYIGNQRQLTGNTGNTSGILSIVLQKNVLGDNINATINILETFGTTRSISSPRLTAMHNQNSSIRFEDSLVYYELKSNTNSSIGSISTTNLVNTTIESVRKEIPTGTFLDIKPLINLDSKEIILDVKPEISIQSGFVADPTTDAQGNNIGNVSPQIKKRTLSVKAKIKDGDVLVLGGLLKDDTTDSDSAIPLIHRIPVIGWIFKSISKTSSITETVIFLKATIINEDSTSLRDREFSDKFDINKGSFFGGEEKKIKN